MHQTLLIRYLVENGERLGNAVRRLQRQGFRIFASNEKPDTTVTPFCFLFLFACFFSVPDSNAKCWFTNRNNRASRVGGSSPTLFSDDEDAEDDEDEDNDIDDTDADECVVGCAASSSSSVGAADVVAAFGSAGRDGATQSKSKATIKLNQKNTRARRQKLRIQRKGNTTRQT